MTLQRAPNRKVRTISIALLISSFAARPKTMAELNDLMALRGTPTAQQLALRKAWIAGGIVFFCEDTMEFASRATAFTAAYVRREFDRSIAQSQVYLRSLARRLVAGKIDVAQFQQEAEREIETANWDAALLLMGPLAFALPQLVDKVRGAILRQVTWFRRLLADIASGRQRLDGSLLRRIAMYAGSGHATVEDVGRVVALMGGRREERNVLGIAEHCEGCLRETARGWVSIGALVPIGERDCLTNCRCNYEYR